MNNRIIIESTSCKNSVRYFRMLISKHNSESGVQIRFLNSYNLGLAFMNMNYFSLLANSGFNLPDGRPITIISNFFKIRGKTEQVRGIDFFRYFLECENQNQICRHLFLGGTDKTLDQIRSKIGIQYPNIKEMHFWNPGNLHKEEFDYDYLSRVLTDTGADIIWIGLGTPLQDYVSSSISSRFPRVTTINIGAAFDFFSGTKNEAPAWFRKLGLEWFYRFLSEPRRLLKRYFLVSPLFPMVFVFKRVVFRIEGKQ